MRVIEYYVRYSGFFALAEYYTIENEMEEMDMKQHRIYWTNGQVSISLPSNAVYNVVRGAKEPVSFIEDMDMKPYIDKVLYALNQGYTAHDGNGLFFSYLIDGLYSVYDPATKDEDAVSEMDIRRRLQIYYKANPNEMEDDIAYIEEWLKPINVRGETYL
jgi:hypothetical protein